MVVRVRERKLRGMALGDMGKRSRAISSRMDEGVSCMHTVEYYAAAKRRELLLCEHRVESPTFLLSQRSRHRSIYCIIPFI